MGVLCSCFKQANQGKIIQDPCESLHSQSSSAILRTIKGRAVKNSILIHKSTIQQKKKQKVLPDLNFQPNQNVETTQIEPYSQDLTIQQNFENLKSEKSNQQTKQEENLDKLNENQHQQDLEIQQNGQKKQKTSEESKNSMDAEEIKSLQ